MGLLAYLGWFVAVIICISTQSVAGNRVSGNSHECSPLVVDAKSEKLVCVCDADYCDKLLFDWPQNPGDAMLVESNKGGLRFRVRKLDNQENLRDHKESQGDDVVRLSVNQGSERQSILGFGGAFTDAAGYNVQSVPKTLRKMIVESYFGEHGSQYTFGRVVIGGSDFSLRGYSYDDAPANSSDFDLKYWSLAPEDHHYKIPLIKEALRIVGRHNRSLNLFGSSWSPPAFMKTSKSLIRGHLIDDDKVYKSYAKYLMKFYKAYKDEGISFWGGTVQNEPIAAGSFYNSLQMTSQETIKFVANYLGPALVANGYTKDNFKLMVNDDNIDALLDQTPTIMADENVRKYVAGLAYHWYNHDKVPYAVLSQCYDEVKDKIEFMLSTEACVEPNGGKPVDLGSWDRAESYAKDIIEGLNRYSSGWVDWNMVLDEKGGPNWAGNFVDSPIIISEDKSCFYKQPMYYALAHFSRFFRPGSVVIDVTRPNASASEPVLAAGAIKKDTGHLVINILNNYDYERRMTVTWQSSSKTFTVKARSLTTFVGKLIDTRTSNHSSHQI